MKTADQIIEENSIHAMTIIEHAKKMTHLYAIQSIIMVLMVIASRKFGVDITLFAKEIYNDISKEADDDITFGF